MAFFLAERKTTGDILDLFDLFMFDAQPCPKILAHFEFSKSGQVKFWPDNENSGFVLQKSIISLLQLGVNRNGRKMFSLFFGQGCHNLQMF